VPTFRTVEVVEVLSERSGLQRVRIRGAPVGELAYVLTHVTGPVAVGDRVVVNTTAVERNLGTGGWHVVHWNLDRDRLEMPGPDHVMKLRYTSLQFDAGTDELIHPDVPDHLGGIPVVACLVHSQVGVIAAVLKDRRPDLTVVYVMTDGAALPLALSDLVAELRERTLLDGTVTAGHAFGGDLEAVTIPSALLLARHVLGADVVIVGMGPGVVGTGTRFGTTAVEAAHVIDDAAALGGRPVLCLRGSSTDPRDRHRGLSHHVRSVLELAHSTPATADDGDDASEVAEILGRLGLEITTMGRGPAEDPRFFALAGAAAGLTIDLVEGRADQSP
jgi:hypothetical protein